MGRSLRIAAVPILLLGPGASARAAEWEWSIAPYVWASGISLDAEVRQEPVLGADLSFADLLDMTEFAAMVHVEAARGRGGFFADALFLAAEANETTSGGPAAPPGTHVEVEVDLGLYEVGGLIRLLRDRHGLDLLLGARVLDIEHEFVVTPPPPPDMVATLAPSTTHTDGFLGLRYRYAPGSRWDVVVRGDVGAGDTELTWNAVGTVGVGFGETGRYRLRFGYRHMDMEVEDDSDRGILIETRTRLSGPLVGFVFEF